MTTQELKDRFQQRIIKCKKEFTYTKFCTSDVWNERRNEFIGEALSLDLDDFTHWRQVDGKMTYQPDDRGVEFLKSLPDWVLWKGAIARPKMCNSDIHEPDPESCGIIVNQAHHLANFLIQTKNKLADFDTIFEFGGGYGPMCGLVYNLGFTGQYIIADFPEMCALQEYYLSLNFPHLKISYNEYSDSADVILLTDIPLFDDLMEEKRNAMLIALWSLSECPIILRECVLNKAITELDSVLIAYQIEWYGYDNQKYFSNLSKDTNSFQWKTIQVSYLDEQHWYMYGKRKDIK